MTNPAYDYTHFPEIAATAVDAYAQAGVTDPRAELRDAEVHDCFTITELVLMEDLGFSERGAAWARRARRTRTTSTATCPSTRRRPQGLRSPDRSEWPADEYEVWLQLRGEAPPERQIAAAAPRDPEPWPSPTTSAATGEMVSFVGIVGR